MAYRYFVMQKTHLEAVRLPFWYLEKGSNRGVSEAFRLILRDRSLSKSKRAAISLGPHQKPASPDPAVPCSVASSSATGSPRPHLNTPVLSRSSLPPGLDIVSRPSVSRLARPARKKQSRRKSILLPACPPPGSFTAKKAVLPAGGKGAAKCSSASHLHRRQPRNAQLH